MLAIILGRLGLPASLFINEQDMQQAFTKRTQRQGARYSSWRGGKVVLESDRVWPRRTARHSVAFSCSPRRLELGGRRCGGCTTEHMPTTPPNQGCPRATLAPNRPPALHNCPASGPVQLRLTKNAVGGRCLGASWSQTGTDSGYLCVLCPWPTCTLHIPGAAL